MNCRGCGQELDPANVVCDLGMQPLANELVTDLDHAEIRYPTRPLVCSVCLLMQLPAVDGVFHADYPFYAGQSQAWRRHCTHFVETLLDRGLSESNRVLEIGSNDGTLTSAFLQHGMQRTMGVEPCAEVAQSALREGLAVDIQFWTEDYAERLVDRGYSADLVVATNVLAHVPDLQDFLRAIKTVLEPDGEIVFEVPHVAKLIQDGRFDQIYAEHHCYFSMRSLWIALLGVGLDIGDVQEVPTHGGSLRIYAGHMDHWQPSERVSAMTKAEDAQGLYDMSTYLSFYPRPAAVKTALLRELTSSDCVTWGYGASAKAVTLMNYCGIDPSMITAIADTTPAKQGKFAPGCRIPIVSSVDMAAAQPERIVNFLWNWAEESERNIRKACPEALIINPFDCLPA